MSSYEKLDKRFWPAKEQEIIKYLDCPTRQVLIEKAPFMVKVVHNVRASSKFKDKEHFSNYAVILDSNIFLMVKPVSFQDRMIALSNLIKEGSHYVSDVFKTTERVRKLTKYYQVIDFAFEFDSKNDINYIGCWIPEPSIEICLNNNGKKVYICVNEGVSNKGEWILQNC